MSDIGGFDFSGVDVLAYGVVTAVGALLSYVAARISMLADWSWFTGVLRLFALWLLAAWLGYGTPIYVALAMLPMALVWVRLRDHLMALMLFEVVIALVMVWHSQTLLVAINVAALIVIDQCFARLTLLRFDKREKDGVVGYRILLVLGLLGALVLVAHFQRLALVGYVQKHGLLASLELVPQGAARFWYQPRRLPADELPVGVMPAVYWQARVPASGENCLLTLHGAAAEGSLQGAAQVIGRGAAHAGFRVYALDHPGYGASHAPLSMSNIDAWNPGLHTDLLTQVMRREGCVNVAVLGHSQGVTEALRLVVSGEPLLASWILGAGLFLEDSAREDYWFERFHIDRGLVLPDERLDKSNWKLIRDFYYLNQEYCADTPIGRTYVGSTPLNYVTFAQEHENLVATREQLWDCLGYAGKARTQLKTDHYLNSLIMGGSGRIGRLVLAPRSSSGMITQLLRGSSGAVDGDSTRDTADQGK